MMSVRLLSPTELRQKTRQFPCVSLGVFPTPLDRWDRLAASIGGTGAIYAKREDLSGLALGGNKVRQLEFLLGEARANGADVIVHGGAIQSNYCRMLAAAAAKLGLETHLVLANAYKQPRNQGNTLLMKLCGAQIEWYDGTLGQEYEAHKRGVSERLSAAGRKPYLITYPASEIMGTIAFVDAAIELFEQCRHLPKMPRWLFTSAVGSTQSGLLLGARLLGWDIRIIGISPLNNEFDVPKTLRESIVKACNLLKVKNPVRDEEIVNSTEFVGDGYARVSGDGLHALLRVARTEGVYLDPVYTSKAMAGLLGYASRKAFRPEHDVIFVHTGGVPALFAYADAISSDDA